MIVGLRLETREIMAMVDGWTRGWLVGLLVGWLGGWVAMVAGWLGGCGDGEWGGWVGAWLAGWLVGWLAGDGDWVVGWLAGCAFLRNASGLSSSSYNFRNDQNLYVFLGHSWGRVRFGHLTLPVPNCSTVEHRNRETVTSSEMS